MKRLLPILESGLTSSGYEARCSLSGHWVRRMAGWKEGQNWESVSRIIIMYGVIQSMTTTKQQKQDSVDQYKDMELYQMGNNLYVSADTRRFSVEQKLNAFLSKRIRTVVNMTKKCTDSEIDSISDWCGHLDYVKLRINDAFKGLPANDEKLLVRWAGELYGRTKDHGVLIHCYGGENRSCLLAGMVMVKAGMSGRAAVSKIQDIRPTALYNEAFKDYLEGYHG